MKQHKKKHRQSRYFTIMLVPDSTVSKVRSLKVPHWILYLIAGSIVCVTLIIGGLSTLNSYSQIKLEQTVKIIEEAEHEKQEILDEKEKMELAKQRIERSLNSQKGDFDKQIDFYLEQITAIETRLIEIENQAKESYEKMSVAGSPISKKEFDSFVGGYYSPVIDENTSKTDRLNTLIASLNVQFENTEGFLKDYDNDVDKYVAFQNAMPNIWPVTGRVTSEYGGRSDPINGSAASHTGIDIKASIGTNVKATGAGVVKRAEYSSGYGYLVVLDHGYGIETYYAHNSQLMVRAGQKVNRGDIVAKSGNTGRSTGPHVHYEVRVGGVIKNPREYLD